MERELLNQIWPIFSAEAREHLAAISTGVLELEDVPGSTGTLDALRRTAHSLKGSAGSLGLAELERLAHAIEGSLSKYDPAEGLARATVMAALEAVQAIEEALAAGDAGGDPGVPRLRELLTALGAAPPPEAAGEAGEARPEQAAASRKPSDRLALLDGLEESCAQLVQPLEDAERKQRAAAASEIARRLAQLVDSPIPERLAGSFEKLGAGGPDGARAAAAIAGDLVELRGVLEQPEEAPAAPAPAAPAPAAGAAASPADKSIRVLASTMDSLTRQLELLALGESRHRRRAGQVREAEVTARETLRVIERASHALRVGDVDDARTDLTTAMDRLRGVAVRLSHLAQEGGRDADSQRLTGTLLREDLRALRMVPASVALEPLRRAVRDVAGRTGKEVELIVSGAEVRLDRRVVDELRDPLLHLVRNAVDHGVELPEVRKRAGKPARGQVRVRVELRGTRVGLVVEDDGQGLDLAAVRAAAVRRGVLEGGAAARLSDGDAAQLIFQAGLSTAAAVTEISGRGVGLDVVRDTANRLQGTVEVSFDPGKGTRFDLDVPLTLSAAAALLFRVGRDLAALPAETVLRVLLLAEGDVGTVAGRPTVKVGGAQLPYATSTAILGVAGAPQEGRPRLRPALVVAAGGQRVVLGVEEVLGQQELVVSALGSRMNRVPHLAGAAVLDDGRVVGVLAAGELVRRAQPAGSAPRAAGIVRTRIMVADDSLTTRSAMKALLEIAGYTVIAAADGEEAFAQLATANAALVVSDVQMPRLDGLGLTRRIKADPRLRATPVILVTSLDAPEDRAAGLEAGADGYLVKREVERGKLLDLVRQLLPGRT
jgi:two-component system chemotaxis sensor kinase CheA